MTNVPLVLWGPGRVPGGKVIDETVQSIDLAPTLLELSGLVIPKTMQGQSLVPWLKAEDSKTPPGWRRRPAISEHRRAFLQRQLDPRATNSTAIVWEGFKLIHNTDRPPGSPEYELYDHRKDLLNLVDLAVERPEVVKELASHLESWRRWVEGQRLPSDAEATEGLDQEALERLRSLGYVQ